MAETADVAPLAVKCVRLLIPGILVLAAVIVPRWLAYSSAGGLWRDEVHSVNMAMLPADDLFFVMTNDSFPVLWPIVLRSWIAAFGGGDESVRALGFVIGLSIIPTMWWMARQFGVAFPWWLMVLLGLDPSLIVYGGEVRGYGLGILTFLILIGASWRTLKQPSSLHWAGLFVAALLAVQSSFTNCFLLAATFIACAIVSLRRGRLPTCLGFAGIGILAAASMAPYALYVFPRLSGIIKPFVEPVPWWTPIGVFLNMYKWGGGTRSLIFLVVALIGSCEILKRLTSGSVNLADQTIDEQDLALFLPPFFWIGTAGFWFYMALLRVYTAYWYHLPWLTLLVVTAELQMELWTRHQPRRQFLNICFAVVTCAGVLFQIVPRVCMRMTSLDQIAKNLEESVRPDDLVVVAPWYLGVPFQRYYRGSAEWTKVPNIDGRYRPFEELLERVNIRPPSAAIETELNRIETVLKSGGRVWWVGPLPSMSSGEAAEIVSGRHDPKPDGRGSEYVSFWENRAVAQMKSTKITVRDWIKTRPDQLNPHELPSVFLIERIPSDQDGPSETGPRSK